MTEFEQPTGQVRPSSRRHSAAAAWALVLVAAVGAGMAGRVIDDGGPDSITPIPTAGARATPDQTPVRAAVRGGDPDAEVTPGPMETAGPSSVWRLGGDGVVGSRGVDLGELRRRGDETRRTLRPLLRSWSLERRQL